MRRDFTQRQFAECQEFNIQRKSVWGKNNKIYMYTYLIKPMGKAGEALYLEGATSLLGKQCFCWLPKRIHSDLRLPAKTTVGKITETFRAVIIPPKQKIPVFP